MPNMGIVRHRRLICDHLKLCPKMPEHSPVHRVKNNVLKNNVIVTCIYKSERKKVKKGQLKITSLK